MIKALLRKIWPRRAPQLERVIPEISPAEKALFQRFSAYTMTGAERQWALTSAIAYLNANRIAGDIVECGVWRGGNMLIAKELCKGSPLARRFYLYDTFTGMSAPGAAEVSAREDRRACRSNAADHRGIGRTSRGRSPGFRATGLGRASRHAGRRRTRRRSP